MQLDDPRAVRLCKDVTLRANMGKLVSFEHLRLYQGLQCVYLRVSLALHEFHFSESAFANGLDRLEVPRRFFGAKEADVLCLLFHRAIDFLVFMLLGETGVVESSFQFESASSFISSSMSCIRDYKYLPCVSLSGS